MAGVIDLLSAATGRSSKEIIGQRYQAIEQNKTTEDGARRFDILTWALNQATTGQKNLSTATEGTTSAIVSQIKTIREQTDELQRAGQLSEAIIRKNIAEIAAMGLKGQAAVDEFKRRMQGSRSLHDMLFGVPGLGDAVNQVKQIEDATKSIQDYLKPPSSSRVGRSPAAPKVEKPVTADDLGTNVLRDVTEQARRAQEAYENLTDRTNVSRAAALLATDQYQGLTQALKDQILAAAALVDQWEAAKQKEEDRRRATKDLTDFVNRQAEAIRQLREGDKSNYEITVEVINAAIKEGAALDGVNIALVKMNALLLDAIKHNEDFYKSANANNPFSLPDDFGKQKSMGDQIMDQIGNAEPPIMHTVDLLKILKQQGEQTFGSLVGGMGNVIESFLMTDHITGRSVLSMVKAIAAGLAAHAAVEIMMELAQAWKEHALALASLAIMDYRGAALHEAAAGAHVSAAGAFALVGGVAAGVALAIPGGGASTAGGAFAGGGGGGSGNSPAQYQPFNYNSPNSISASQAGAPGSRTGNLLQQLLTEQQKTNQVLQGLQSVSMGYVVGVGAPENPSAIGTSLQTAIQSSHPVARDITSLGSTGRA